MELSDWEGEFLGSVEQRLNTYGRAVGDPEKGAPGTAMSVRQGVKLKEITAKAQGKPKGKDKAKPKAKTGRAGLVRSGWRGGSRHTGD